MKEPTGRIQKKTPNKKEKVTSRMSTTNNEKQVVTEIAADAPDASMEEMVETVPEEDTEKKEEGSREEEITVDKEQEQKENVDQPSLEAGEPEDTKIVIFGEVRERIESTASEENQERKRRLDRGESEIRLEEILSRVFIDPTLNIEPNKPKARPTSMKGPNNKTATNRPRTSSASKPPIPRPSAAAKKTVDAQLKKTITKQNSTTRKPSLPGLPNASKIVTVDKEILKEEKKAEPSEEPTKKINKPVISRASALVSEPKKIGKTASPAKKMEKKEKSVDKPSVVPEVKKEEPKPVEANPEEKKVPPGKGATVTRPTIMKGAVKKPVVGRKNIPSAPIKSH